MVHESGLPGRNCSSFGGRGGCGVLSLSLSILFLRSRIDGRHPFGVKLRPGPASLRTREGEGGTLRVARGQELRLQLSVDRPLNITAPAKIACTRFGLFLLGKQEQKIT